MGITEKMTPPPTLADPVRELVGVAVPLSRTFLILPFCRTAS